MREKLETIEVVRERERELYSREIKRGKVKQRGITLVALVVTMVILIILATVSINAVFGDKGLIKQAENVRDMAEDSIDKESDDLNRLAQEYENLMGEDGEESVPPSDVPIPDDFYYVGGKKDEGVVISDNSADENKGIDHDVAQGLQGNQFVWVPVEDLSAMFVEETATLCKSSLGEEETTTNVYSKLRMREGDYWFNTTTKPGDTSMRSAREPDILPDKVYGDAVTGNRSQGIKQIKSVFGYTGTDAEVLKQFAQANVDEYKEMYESVKKYKGFYIGRYELSGSIGTPTSKAGAVLATGEGWWKLKKACMDIIQGKANTKSTMIYGNQWDETMNWLKKTKFAGDPDKVDKDSSGWGNYEINGVDAEKQPTGSKVEWSANHIYDLAGNYHEWTQEASDTDNRDLFGRRL